MKRAYTFLLAIACLSFAAHGALTNKIVYPCLHPDSGYFAYGEMSITADVKTDAGTTITKVEFYVDNQLVYADPLYPYSYLWSARHSILGYHALKSIAYNSTGQKVTDTLTVNVHNTPPADKRRCDSTSYKAGLVPKLAPMFECALRDPSICLGPDSIYYLVATTGADAWVENEGIVMWRSKDLQHWTYIGVVWNFDRDGTASEKQWNNWSSTGSSHKGLFRLVWAPEICYVKNNYYIAWNIPWLGSKLMKSTTGHPEGPYANVKADNSFLVDSIDSQLFEDTDGKTYFVWKNGMIRQMNDQITDTISVGGNYGKGFEGPCLFKHNNNYYLSVAASISGRYSSYVGIASSITGPYLQWHEAIPTGGHNTYFYDRQGTLWSTYFGNEANAAFQQRLGLMQMTTNTDGTLKPSTTQPAFISGGPYPLLYDSLPGVSIGDNNKTSQWAAKNVVCALYGRSLSVTTKDAATHTVTLFDVHGRTLFERTFAGSGSFQLSSEIGTGIVIIAVKDIAGHVEKSIVARTF